MKGTRKLRHLNVMNNTEHYENFMRDVKNSYRYFLFVLFVFLQ